MERFFRNAYGEGFSNNRGLVDDGQDGLDAGTGGESDIIGNLNGQNGNGNFTEEEWFRQLHQQNDMMGQGEELARTNQYRVSYDQNNQLSTDKNKANHTSHSGMDQMRFQEPQQNQAQHLLNPSPQNINGLDQFQGVDNMNALNNLLQQQQQNNPNQSTFESTQPLEQQLAALQQQLQQQPQNIRPDSHETQNMAITSLHENLLQLQKLQEQQQQILKNISENTGLVADPNSLMNPIGALLSTLLGQMNGNNSISNDTGNDGNNDNDNNDMNSSMSHDPNEWVRMRDQQGMENSTAMTMLPQHDQQQQHEITDFVNTNAPLRAPRPLQLPPSVTRKKDQRRRLFSDQTMASARRLSREPSPNTNINIEFPTPPIIRKADNKKRQKPKSFPSQLWDAMMTTNPRNDEAFEWLPDGKSFVIVDPELFCKEILDRKFKQSKYGSFVRKLHRWGFIRLTSGTGTDCFHHPHFQKLRPELVSQIKSKTRKDDGTKGHNAYARGEYHMDSVQPSLMGVEKFIRTKVVSTDDVDDLPL